MESHFSVLTNEGEKRRNRKWPSSQKAAIVAETLEPGASVNAGAARHGVPANRVSSWRRMARDGKLVLPAPDEAVEFVSLIVAPAGSPVEPAQAAGTGPVEIAIGAVTVRLESGASAERIATVMPALASSRPTGCGF